MQNLPNNGKSDPTLIELMSMNGIFNSFIEKCHLIDLFLKSLHLRF